MTGLEIGLLIIGAIFFVGSFFIAEKLSDSDMNEIEGMSEDQIRILLEKKIGEASLQIDKLISEKTDTKLEEFEAGADKETNERIMSIGEYADSVFKSIDKTHGEILFLYQMLNDKQEALTRMTKTLGDAESHVRELLLEAKKTGQASPIKEKPKKQKTDEESAPDTEAVEVRTEESGKERHEPAAPDEASSDEEKSGDDSGDDKSKGQNERLTDQEKAAIKEKVISMHREGYSELEIARETGKGMREIQMILDLFADKE